MEYKKLWKNINVGVKAFFTDHHLNVTDSEAFTK